MNVKQSQMLLRFEEQLPRLQLFTKKIEDLIRDLLSFEGIPVHNVTSRVKTKESLQSKLLRPEKNYTSLTEVTDICGVRITTYFREDVDKIAALLEKEFAIDWEHSVDRRQSSDPDRFGYQSMHHVLAISKQRARLREYRNVSQLKVEVQTRSILQHAWAEIEHDLGYKTQVEVPREIRRRFSRLAGLLELADEEFQVIRAYLGKYESELPLRIEQNPDAIAIDLASLNAYMLTSLRVRHIDQQIAKCKNFRVSTRHSFAKAALPRLSFIGIQSIGALDKLLEAHGNEARFFAETLMPWTDGPRHRAPIVDAGISVFHLCYALLTQPKDPLMVEHFVQEIGLGAMSHRLLEIRGDLDRSTSKM